MPRLRLIAHCVCPLVLLALTAAPSLAQRAPPVRTPGYWSPGNLTGNPSLELGADMENQPVYWRPAAEFPGAKYEFTDARAATGRYSLAIGESIDAGGGYLTAGWSGQPFRAIPGVAYRFTAKVDSGSWPSASFAVLAWYDDSGKWIGNTRNGSVVSTPGRWLTIAAADVAPADAVAGRPYLRSDSNPGVAYFDDVSLEVLPGPTVELPVANGDFELDEPTSWAAAGQQAAWGRDANAAHAGEGCLVLRAGPGISSWTSPRLGTEGPGVRKWRAILWVDSSRATKGAFRARLRWELISGDTTDGPVTDLPLGTTRWTRVSIPVDPPEDAAYARLVLDGAGLDGPVGMDDLSLEFDMPAQPSDTEVALATGLAYESCVSAPDICDQRFLATFPDPEERARVADLVCSDAASELAQQEVAYDLFSIEALYHAGSSAKAGALADATKSGLNPSDAQYDLAQHYEYWAKVAIEKAAHEKQVAELDARLQAATDDFERKTVADEYAKAGANDRAAPVFDGLAKGPDADLARYAAFRSGICYAAAKDHATAVDRLRAFLPENAWTRWANDAALQLGRSLLELGRHDDCLETVRALSQNTDAALRGQAEDIIRSCYLRRIDNPDVASEYARVFGMAPPRLVYLGTDTGTKGNWPARYGDEAFVLCGMASPRSIGGGRRTPVLPITDRPGKAGGVTLAWAGSETALVVSIGTGTPEEMSRGAYPQMETDDERALVNPVWGTRTHSHWDDRGEVHPYDNAGPDLLVSVDVPAGAWIMSFYFADWDYDPNAPYPARLPVTVADARSGAKVEFEVSDFAGGVYHSVAVQGPMKANVRIRKGYSLCATLNGLFLDPIALPPPAVMPPPERLSPEVRGWGDLLATDPVGFALSWKPPACTTPDDRFAAWLLAESLPGARRGADELISTWLAAEMAEQGGAVALTRAWSVFDFLAREERVPPGESLARALLAVDSAPGRLIQVARPLRKRDLMYAMTLIDRYGASEALGKGELVTAGREWFGIAEQDRAASHNMDRTCFKLSEKLLRAAEARFGLDALGEEGLYALAESRVRQNWFDMGWAEAAAELERFFARYPDSQHMDRVLWDLATCYDILSQVEPHDVPSPSLTRLAEVIDETLARHKPDYLLADAVLIIVRSHVYRQEYQDALKWAERARGLGDDMTARGANRLIEEIKAKLPDGQKGG